MAKYKKHPKYNVVSMRISDEEKQLLEEMTRNSSKSISLLMREAMLQYSHCFPAAKSMRQADR